MKVLITGGAGFIGVNAAASFLALRDKVYVYDNLCRPGTGANLRWLKAQGKPVFCRGDIRDVSRLRTFFRRHGPFALILHLAGQVAVTTSVIEPREDFEINALGTFNLLEATRQYSPRAVFIFASTNKVYGGLEKASVVKGSKGYRFQRLKQGIPEDWPLDFHSPYGCSKGAADQYVRDYHRIYGLKTVVMRQSCIYGYRQFGLEDQGWVAWFLIALNGGIPVTIYGDGLQVRDILFIDDLVAAYRLVYKNIGRSVGRVYNIGGGPRNAIAVREVIDYYAAWSGKPVRPRRSGWRPGDQKIYISDIRKAGRELSWSPKVSAAQGIARLNEWISENLCLFKNVLPGV